MSDRKKCKYCKDEHRNSEGYFDLTAYEALNNVVKKKKKEKKDDKLHEVLRSIRAICTIYGFEIEGRIVLKDVKSDKIYR